jgi:hypothetical protein
MVSLLAGTWLTRHAGMRSFARKVVKGIVDRPVPTETPSSVPFAIVTSLIDTR